MTFSCNQRKSILTNDSWRRRLAELIDAACVAHEMDLNAFVFMPNHVHLLIYPRQPDPQIGRFLAAFKQPFSKFVKQIFGNQSKLLTDLIVLERPGKSCFRF